MVFETVRQDWEDLDPKWRYILISLVALGAVIVGYRAITGNSHDAAPETAKFQQGGGADAARNDPSFRSNVVPSTNRNQGLEVMETEINSLREEVARMKSGIGTATQTGPTLIQQAHPAGAPASPDATPSVDLDKAIPPPGPVNFDQPGSTDKNKDKSPADIAPPPAKEGTSSKMHTWASETPPVSDVAVADEPGPVIPVNSALEAVMLSGVNARPTGAIGGAAGSVNSANNVGAPFITRLKGDAILPNSWKMSDLGDCFLGGSAIAVLSTERAYAVSETLSCVNKNGEIYEGPVKAYALDTDGTLGIAGKVVSKQGSLLMQAALTGMASGLGTALSPSTIPSYNSNATSGSTASIQYPNPALVGYTAVGQGINQASSQLSKFYLEYAREIFPVVEVVSGTRVTWILKESVELKKKANRVPLK